MPQDGVNLSAVPFVSYFRPPEIFSWKVVDSVPWGRCRLLAQNPFCRICCRKQKWPSAQADASSDPPQVEARMSRPRFLWDAHGCLLSAAGLLVHVRSCPTTGEIFRRVPLAQRHPIVLTETLSKLQCGLKLFLFKTSIPLPFQGCQISILI